MPICVFAPGNIFKVPVYYSAAHVLVILQNFINHVSYAPPG